MNFLAQVEKAWSVKSVSWKKEKSQCIKYDTIIYSCTVSSSRSTLSTQVYELISPVDRHLSPPAITRYYHPPSAITSYSHPTPPAKGRGHFVILFSTTPLITTIILRSSSKFLAGGRWWWLIMASDWFGFLIMAVGG